MKLICLILSLFLIANIVYSKEVNTNTLFDNCKTANLGFKWNKRKNNGFASYISAPPNTVIYSNCIKLNELNHTIQLRSHSDIQISVNNASFRDLPVNVKNADKIVLRTKTRPIYKDTRTLSITLYGDSTGDLKIKSGLISWVTQTVNTKRPAKTWLVGPNHKYTQLSDITSKLSAGDEIFLEGGATYNAIEIKGVSGTKEAPIRLIGITVNNQRPVIEGNAENRYNWAFALRNSHYWEIENVVIEKGDICYRHESAFITIKDVLIQHCGNGILGTDGGSGSLTVSNSEIRYSGGQRKNKKWEHAIYFATDRDKFPKSKLLLTNSFLHNNKGNTVKTRAEKAYIYGNWIENSNNNKSIYTIELIGFDGYDTIQPIHHDVTGNVISINSKQYGIRVGGDGTGFSNGITNLSENLFLINNESFDGYVFRLAGKLQKLLIQNNLFIDKLNNKGELALIRDYIEPQNWPLSQPNILVKNNKLSSKIVPYSDKNGKKIDEFKNKYKHIKVLKNEYISNSYSTLRSLSNIHKIFEKSAYETIHPPLDGIKVFSRLNNPFLYQKPRPGKVPYR